ncbi:MAG: TRAP transporter small permease [Treponema sp.]|jgi:TRAP-type C4-dicarboxylate transport system permease small subunit|nr:TRAP transporter small permease [Treponema sp.]
MKKLYQYYCKFEVLVCGIFFISIVVLVFVSALGRGLRHPIQWTVDISQLLLAWVSFLGADIAWRHGQILGLDIITKNFPLKMQKFVELVVLSVILAALIVFIIYGIQLAKSNWKRAMQVVRMSYSFVTLSLPVASVSMSVSTIIKIVERVRDFK